MNFKQRIWLLPILATAIFTIGVATDVVFSSRTDRVIGSLGTVDYPYLDASTQLGVQMEKLVSIYQSAVAEGDKSRMNDVREQAAAIRKTLERVQGIEGKAESAANLSRLFDAYFNASNNTTELFLGIKPGDAAASVPQMQSTQKAFEAGILAFKEEARSGFDAGLAGARKGVSASLYAIYVSAAMVVAGLGLGSYLIIGSVWRQLGGEPEYARDVMRRMAGGDLSQQISVSQGAEASLLAAVREMAQGLSAIVGEVRTGSDMMTHAAREIAAGNQDLSSRTEQQAASLEQTSASMVDLTQNVQRNAESATQASHLAASASSVAARGGEVVNHVVTTMNEISTSSKKIADIIGVIDGIAFQTNILALNAAVESARAGEQGRGFAVVAGEVRTLAQRSAEAAREIKALIGTSVEKVQSGSQLVQQAGETMEEVVSSVARVASFIQEITAAADEQSQGIGKMNEAVGQLDQMTQQNASLVEQAAAAAASMEQQSRALQESVATFKLSGGSSYAADPAYAHS